jgi:hypothetical protein
MPLSTFEKALPWTGAVAGLAWIGQALLDHTNGDKDLPGSTGVLQNVRDHQAVDNGMLACLVVMAVALVFFAAAVRNALRSGEPREATYSTVAYGALLMVAAALGGMILQTKALLSAAADNQGQVVHTLSYPQYYGWMPMSVGVAGAFLAIGLGGVRTATLPRWFALTTAVLGTLALLGACGIPPGGLVGYLVLPFWLITAAVLLARRQHVSSRAASEVLVTA